MQFAILTNSCRGCSPANTFHYSVEQTSPDITFMGSAPVPRTGTKTVMGGTNQTLFTFEWNGVGLKSASAPFVVLGKTNVLGHTELARYALDPLSGKVRPA